eukprot:TRINITY_DN11041_c0_g4_i2.p2 TRINITY_DN11041_c0_g4~~TRINITY_DN11041_c0_g4_i2.p2  ORF type:complete len:133 (-),score=9.58 TRINITY_DN11041_c0_g4_i2:36-434(-)
MPQSETLFATHWGLQAAKKAAWEDSGEAQQPQWAQNNEIGLGINDGGYIICLRVSWKELRGKEKGETKKEKIDPGLGAHPSPKTESVQAQRPFRGRRYVGTGRPGRLRCQGFCTPGRPTPVAPASKVGLFSS